MCLCVFVCVRRRRGWCQSLAPFLPTLHNKAASLAGTQELADSACQLAISLCSGDPLPPLPELGGHRRAAMAPSIYPGVWTQTLVLLAQKALPVLSRLPRPLSIFCSLTSSLHCDKKKNILCGLGHGGSAATCLMSPEAVYLSKYFCVLEDNCPSAIIWWLLCVIWVSLIEKPATVSCVLDFLPVTVVV